MPVAGPGVLQIWNSEDDGVLAHRSGVVHRMAELVALTWQQISPAWQSLMLSQSTGEAD